MNKKQPLTSAEKKRAQRERDKKLLKSLGFNSLEGIMSALRKGEYLLVKSKNAHIIF